MFPYCAIRPVICLHPLIGVGFVTVCTHVVQPRLLSSLVQLYCDITLAHHPIPRQVPVFFPMEGLQLHLIPLGLPQSHCCQLISSHIA